MELYKITTMNSKNLSRARTIFVMVFCWASVFELLGQSNSYQLQTDDRLQISFWENPDLNTQVTVGKDGGIELPVIGRLTAAGLAVPQLRDKIISQMGLYNKLITQLTIAVTEYGHNRVYVNGQVRNPGRYSFEEIPNLWDVILEAGGPLETSFLNEITIVRGGDEGKIFTVDLANALRLGRLNELPKILPGDTIHIPGTTVTGATPSPLLDKTEVYVLGAVTTPGAHKFEPNLNVLEVISKAGGPTLDADLKRVKHVSVSHGAPSVVLLNLEKYLDTSVPVPMPVGAGDTIFVPHKPALSPLVLTALTATITVSVTSLITVAFLR
jgi:protein involved in polysaccharide export with SLBB domain